ncbi:hypothetical protein V6N13_018908 [Hibiscus sabdariffa]|uniref:Uncharacterized protein n=1 Tax=Hibiscus sabdariffa TaxID=183260 RepID=A0ABR2EM76_9ROSI
MTPVPFTNQATFPVDDASPCGTESPPSSIAGPAAMNDTTDASATEPTTPTVTAAVDTAKNTIDATLPSALAVKEGTQDDTVSIQAVNSVVNVVVAPSQARSGNDLQLLTPLVDSQ